MTAFGVLLEVQEHDTAIDRLLHRRETLPDRRELADVEARLAALAARLGETAARRDEVAGRQSQLEHDLALSEARIGTLDKRMYSGEVSATRDLQAMAAEIDSLKRRVSSLEDHTLEVMDEREPLDAEVAGLEQQREELEAAAGVIRRRIAAAEAEIDGEVAVERERRQTLAAQLPAELASSYERLRARLGGVGAARLEHGSCTGCHLKLPATELDRLKRLPADALVHCEQCGRILVHEASHPPPPPAPPASPASPG